MHRLPFSPGEAFQAGIAREHLDPPAGRRLRSPGGRRAGQAVGRQPGLASACQGLPALLGGFKVFFPYLFFHLDGDCSFFSVFLLVWVCFFPPLSLPASPPSRESGN